MKCEEILKKEEEHANDLSNMLATLDPEKAPPTRSTGKAAGPLKSGLI
jgi:hypothetical protein